MPALPPNLGLGPVHLVVRDLERSLDWYQGPLALQLHRRDQSEAELGDGRRTVVVLHEDPEARPAASHAGLYHYALLYPSREELARAIVRVASARTPIQGLSDHGTHEALYLPDPDGNGLELAADRPPGHWPSDMYAHGPAPLDLDNLLATVADEPRSPKVGQGLRVGHMHLHVGDIDQGLAFYRDTVGFEQQANLGTAAFVSAGGYHHHLGFNVWKGRGVGEAPPHTVGLLRWTIELPGARDVEAVRARLRGAGAPLQEVEGGFETRDPWNTALVFRSANGFDSVAGDSE